MNEKLPDIYISRQVWTPCDSSLVKSLSAYTGSPGQVYEVAIESLPSGIQSMPGLHTLYVSGSVELTELKSGSLSAAGEFVMGRQATYQGAEIQKNYNFAFAVDNNKQLYFTGPFTDFDAHYQDPNAINIDSLFGHSKLKKSRFPPLSE